ncbi:hypothetical protein [Pseudothioclava arenosa]|uniref:Uncharacterized protein n=1 Tax=Pseudothioclava arenosa TaxID=1795308 RepID=A0A2A4CQK9_9RHOB|nr:hypothetical protein [Pseudothioclava arenosa]PCD76767.1 hypothetical protein CLN94_06580 [Pseudothioclava arenosa]
MDFNCLPHGTTLADFAKAEGFTWLDVSPCRHDESEGCTVRTTPGWVEFWTIYGRTDAGEAMAIHDAWDEEALAQALAEAVKITGLEVGYSDEDRALPAVELLALAEDMTFRIHEELDEEIEDEDRRDDDFDHHELTPLREALCEVSGYYGRE